MRIQHNIMAMNAYRNYSSNTSALSKNLEKLSSGYKINRAGDDAAGLAISEKMRAQVTGLKAAQKNSKDGISLVQTAEGALTEVHSMLNRMVDLADQSANGTYDNDTDRANLQKEFDALRSEVDRIADSTNFNGIKLLDGSLSKAGGVNISALTNSITAAVKSGVLGTTSAKVDGKLTAGDAGTNYSAKFYVGTITNTSATPKTMSMKYKDAEGATQTAVFTVASGKTMSADDVAKGLSGQAMSSGVTMAMGGANASVSASGVLKKGKFSDLYNIRSDGNIITVTAKYKTGEEVIPGGKLIGSNMTTPANAITNTFIAADVKKTSDKLTEDYAAAGTAGTAIVFGSAAGTATANVDPKDGTYKVASAKLTLAGNGKTNHNKGITVGDKLYIIKAGTEDIKGAPDGAIIVNVKETDTATTVGTALAAAISAGESQNGGYVATSAAGVLTISESTRRGDEVLAGTKAAGKGDKVIKQENFTVKDAVTSVTGSLDIDNTKLANGTKVTVGNKTYMLTDDASLNAGNATKITYAKGASNNDIAKALADQLTADGVTGVSNAGGTVNFAASQFSGTGISATGTGLSLQIGDTSENFNRLNVVVNDMHCSALGIDGSKLDISEQPNASAAIESIKAAINSVSSTRGDLGALQNRLEHTINNLSVMTENIQDAEANIRDVDVAEEMMAYTKNNILVQSAQAMLAQANQLPQGVLQLLQ